LSGNGEADLIVSNPLGDVLVLMGNGNGTFQPVQNLDQQVSLAVYPGNGNTPAAFIFADQLTNQLVVQTVGGHSQNLGNAALISPTAATLWDLNNDGILDLIVANGGSNNVLVYRGDGKGGFDPTPLNGGQGFFTGTNPTGITVADVNGDGRPDLIVADKGSNDVSILINNALPDGSFTFVPGDRLQVGNGPVSTAVVKDGAGNVTDLVVANSASNNVWMLPALGNGFFNDQTPTIYAVGTNPSAVFVGQFMGGSGQDLVTVNSGSNDVTLISGLGSASPLMQSISSGGIDPTAALVVASGANGLDSLVVANNGDGNFALLQASENGLALSSVLSSSGLPNPSALALASFSGGNLQFYATTEGEQSAALLGFQLEEAGASSALSSSAGGSAQLLSLNETSLALVGTLLTLTLDLQTETEQSSEGSTGLVGSAGPGAAGQSVFGPSQTSEESEELRDNAPAQPAPNQPNPLSWARYVIGLDQAIESIRREADERLRQEEQPVKVEKPDTTQLDQDDAARRTDTTTFLERAIFGAGRRFDAAEDRLAAIDVTIGSWGPEDPAPLQSLFPILPDPTITKSPTPHARVVEVKDRAELFASLEAEQSRLDESPVGRLATLVAVSAIAASAGASRLKRSTFLVAAGSSPSGESRWKCLNRHRRHPRKLGRG